MYFSIIKLYLNNKEHKNFFVVICIEIAVNHLPTAFTSSNLIIDYKDIQCLLKNHKHHSVPLTETQKQKRQNTNFHRGETRKS